MNKCEQEYTAWRKKRNSNEECLHQEVILWKQVGAEPGGGSGADDRKSDAHLNADHHQNPGNTNLACPIEQQGGRIDGQGDEQNKEQDVVRSEESDGDGSQEKDNHDQQCRA